MVSDAPPTPVTGGIVLKGVSGAMLVINETGIYISNGQGASIADRSFGGDQFRRINRRLKRIVKAGSNWLLAIGYTPSMPGPILHVGAVILCSHQRPASTHRAQPAGIGNGSPNHNDRSTLCGSRVRVCAAGW